MLPLTRARADAYWRGVCASAALGVRIILIAEDALGAITGTVQVLLNQPENQPHRGDIAKMQVRRRARRCGLGAALLAAAESAALEAGKTLLVLDTVTDSACMRAQDGRVAGKSRTTRCGRTGAPVPRQYSSRSCAADGRERCARRAAAAPHRHHCDAHVRSRFTLDSLPSRAPRRPRRIVRKKVNALRVPPSTPKRPHHEHNSGYQDLRQRCFREGAEEEYLNNAHARGGCDENKAQPPREKSALIDADRQTQHGYT